MVSVISGTKVFREDSLNGECNIRHRGPQNVIYTIRTSKCNKLRSTERILSMFSVVLKVPKS